MTEQLEQLKQLVSGGDFDTESQQRVASYEAQLGELLMKEKAIENPVIKEFVDYLQFQVERSEHQLKTNRKLDDRERDALFAKMDICEHFTSLFNGKAREAVRQNIIQDLEHARTQFAP
jgi:hypothetical protein